MRHVWISPAPTPPLIWKRCLFKLVSLLRALCHKNKSSSAGQESSLPNEGTETEYVPIWQRPPKVPPKESLPIGVSSSQQQCSFFSLPIELRDLIYRQVFGHSLIHIITVRKRIAHIVCVEHRLAHLKCPNRRSGDGWDGHEHGVYGTEAGTTVLEDSLYMNDQLLALCLSCRRMCAT